MAEYYELFVENEFKYVFDEPIRIEDLIKGLEGYKGLVSNFLPSILTELVGSKVDKVEVLVNEIRQGSLEEDFKLKLLFKDKDGMDNFTSNVGKLIGTHDISEGKMLKGGFKLLVTAAIAAMMYAAFTYITPKKAEAITNNITIVNVSPDLSGDDIVRVVDSVVGKPSNRKKVQQETQKLLSPSHNNGGDISLGNGKITIPSSILENIPKNEINESANTLEKEYDDIDMNIRASDRDKTTGWFVVIDNIVPTRKKLEFEDPSIDLTRLANNATVRANVVVVKKLDGKGQNYLIDKVILKSFVDDEE